MNLYLIGLRGCGKTSVGRSVAQRLQRPFLDADDQLQRHMQKSIREIFAEGGEAGFRDLEQVVVDALTAQRDVVVAWGGGVVVREENVQRLRATGRTIWLQATPETLAARAAADPATPSERPRLTDANDLVEEFRRVSAARKTQYASCADHVIDTENRSIEDVAQMAIAWWEQLQA
jgi:shikimate kinase